MYCSISSPWLVSATPSKQYIVCSKLVFLTGCVKTVMFYAHSDSQCSAVIMWNEEVDLEGQFWRERARERVCVCVIHTERYTVTKERQSGKESRVSGWEEWTTGQPLCSLAACQQACVRTFPQPEKMQILLWDAAPFLQRQAPKEWSSQLWPSPQKAVLLLHEQTWISLCRLHLDATVNVLNYRSVGITSKMAMFIQWKPQLCLGVLWL